MNGNVTNYKLGDRLKELSSYSGILIVLLTTVLPQVVTPDQVIHVMMPVGAVLGALLFFLPENRTVITAEHVFAAIDKTMPAAYRVALPPDPATASPGITNSVSLAAVGKAAMVLGMLAFLAPLLSACGAGGQLTPQAQAVIGAMCKLDGVAQPIAVTIAPTVLPQLTPAASIDNALVHPAVVAACNAIGGTPVGVQTEAVPAAPAAPVVTAPPPATAPPAAPSATN